MKSGNSALIELIRDEIRDQGPMSFARFMQLALYHPQRGYYSSGRCAIGRKGDYFTNVSIGPLFGQLLGAQFSEIWEGLGKIDNFVIVEQGAHDGQFANDVLEYAQKGAPEFFEALRYRIVEPFPVLQDRQSRLLKPFCEKVEWLDSLQSFAGVHFSNELLDAMPVRLINGDIENLVDLQGDNFVLIERPFSQGAAAFPGTVAAYSAEAAAKAGLAKAAELPGRREVFNQAALEWVDDVAAKLQRGCVIAIDYGHPRDEFQATVQVRSQHRNVDSAFKQIGYADITMRVDWSSIIRRAQANGLRIAGFTDQHHFLTGIISELSRGASPGSYVDNWTPWPLADSPKIKRQLQTLLHPEMLGRAFQVLGLEKNLPLGAPRLAGFRFGREAR
jgi:SAM-dependent MidA family methyltransferase